MSNLNTIFDKIFVCDKFIEENENGNIEYKLRIDTKNENSIKKFKTQMTWRLSEGYEIDGNENAFYVIGIYDDGSLGNLSEEDLDKNILIFQNIINELNFEIIESLKTKINSSYVYLVHITKINISKNISEKNVVIIGDPQSGKTTLISKICYNADIKKNIFKHYHEKLTGITTDIKKEIIGIKNDKVINYNDYNCWEDIYNVSSNLINIFDIPVINMKNTINYLLSININYCIIISKTNIHSKEVKFYENLCKYFNINYKIFYSKDLIEFDKKLFNDIFINLSTTKYSYFNDILNNHTMFRILESYDIPEKKNIVSGIQINKSINIGDILYIVNNTDITKIKIKSIHIKNINYKSIKQNESGCVCFDIIDDIKKYHYKINKNTYITDTLNESIKKIVLKDLLNINGKHFCRIYNANNNYNLILDINNNTIEFEKELILTDKKIIIEINNNFYFNYLFFF
jgi:GTPase